MGRINKQSQNHYRRSTTSCGALTWRERFNKIEILLIKQSKNKNAWGLPKGHTNDGESLEDCARREVKEETGITIKLGSRLPDIIVMYPKEVKTIVTYFAIQTDDANPDPNDPNSEVADALWFNIDNLPFVHIYQQNLIRFGISVLLKRLRGTTEDWEDPWTNNMSMQ